MRPPDLSPFLFLTVFLFLLLAVLLWSGVKESVHAPQRVRFSHDPALHHLFLPKEKGKTPEGAFFGFILLHTGR